MKFQTTSPDTSSIGFTDGIDGVIDMTVAANRARKTMLDVVRKGAGEAFEEISRGVPKEYSGVLEGIKTLGRAAFDFITPSTERPTREQFIEESAMNLSPVPVAFAGVHTLLKKKPVSAKATFEAMYPQITKNIVTLVEVPQKALRYAVGETNKNTTSLGAFISNSKLSRQFSELITLRKPKLHPEIRKAILGDKPVLLFNAEAPRGTGFHEGQHLADFLAGRRSSEDAAEAFASEKMIQIMKVREGRWHGTKAFKAKSSIVEETRVPGAPELMGVYTKRTLATMKALGENAEGYVINVSPDSRMFVSKNTKPEIVPKSIRSAVMSQGEMWEEFSMMRVRMTQKLNGEDLGYRSCFGVGNPPGPAHWCYLWEANRLAQGTPLENKDYFTVNVTTMDNKDNLPEGYIERAKRNLSDRKFRIHFLGSWEALEGQVFSEFSHKDHCLDHDEIPKAHWQKFIAIDYGRTAGHSATFLAVDDDNNLLIYDEAYIEDALVEDHAGLIKNKLDQHKREIEMEYGKCGDEDHIPEIWYHDPSMVRRADQKGERSGESITLVGLYLEALAMKGIEVGMIPANNEIDAGIDRVNFVLRHNRLRFNKRAKHHVAQISSYIYDEKTGKPRSRQKDHCCDTLRYAVSAIFDLIVFPVEEEKPTMVDRIIAQMRERNSSPFDDILESEVF